MFDTKQIKEIFEAHLEEQNNESEYCYLAFDPYNKLIGLCIRYKEEFRYIIGEYDINKYFRSDKNG